MAKEVPWKDARSLEELIREAFLRGGEQELVEMIRKLPVTLRQKCRMIWIEEQEKRKRGDMDSEKSTDEDEKKVW